MYQRQVASEVWSFEWPKRIAGDFMVVATALPGQGLGELQRVVDSVVAQLAEEGPTPRELQQAKNAIEAQFLNGIEGISGKADALNRYMELLGTPDGFQRDVDRHRDVTAADVQEAVRTYLMGPRASISVVPDGKRELAAPGEERHAVRLAYQHRRPRPFAGARAGAQTTATAPTLGPPPTLTMPGVEHSALANGLHIELVSMHELPLAQVTLVIDGGARLDGSRPGITAFTAGMLDEGAGARDAFAFASELEYLGATLQTGATWDAVTLTLRAPTRTIAQAMTLLVDAVLRPRFSALDVARQRDLRIAAILQERDDPQTLARRAFHRNAYPAGHPYHFALGGDSTTVAGFDSTAIRAFWTSIADPRRATLIVTGDLKLPQARAMAQAALADWRPPPRGLPIAAAGKVAAPVPAPTRIVLLDRPDAEQSMIVIGTPAPAEHSRLMPRLRWWTSCWEDPSRPDSTTYCGSRRDGCTMPTRTWSGGLFRAPFSWWHLPEPT